MAKPAIIIPDNIGYHNRSDYSTRLNKEQTYRDLSTIIICPTRGVISATIVQNWMGLMRPMNQKTVGPIFMEEMEVGVAYNEAIKMILENPDLKKYKFVFTLEEDNSLPPDTLLKLQSAIDGGVDGNHYDAIGAIYWTKGDNGMPMMYGDPNVQPLNFIPQNPIPDTVNPCNGLGMGATLFRLEMFKDKRFEYGNWFKTEQSYDPQAGARAYTQDLYFFEKAVGFGYKMACDSRVKVGHWDQENRKMW